MKSYGVRFFKVEATTATQSGLFELLRLLNAKTELADFEVENKYGQFCEYLVKLVQPDIS